LGYKGSGKEKGKTGKGGERQNFGRRGGEEKGQISTLDLKQPRNNSENSKKSIPAPKKEGKGGRPKGRKGGPRGELEEKGPLRGICETKAATIAIIKLLDTWTAVNGKRTSPSIGRTGKGLALLKKGKRRKGGSPEPSTKEEKGMRITTFFQR